MEKTYSPQTIEASLYAKWEQQGYFTPQGQGSAYSIVIPPPNVTGTLHMGHGFQHTLMDALIRYHRMQGYNTLWQPGMDHAGIATQMVVERQLAAEELTRETVGREPFVKKVWQWKEQSGGQICQQIRRLGASPDWSRERFTMDDDFSQTVSDVFIKLYQEGLIYRGKRLVNWDPKFHSAISDLEVITSEEKGSLWYFRYPLTQGNTYLIIATTRPETMLGDTAVAVNPNDARYQHLIGKMIKLPLSNREIPIIADDYVDPEFGSGCVKITPGHDFNDYEIGKRHHLSLINIFTKDVKINQTAPAKYQGLDRFEARKKIIADLEQLGFLEKIEDYTIKIPRGDRSGEIVEPFLTDQWYVKTAPLAKPAIEAVAKGEIEFIPNQWDKTYFQWLENIQDWCISRQLWWGHRIPAWYDEAGNVYVGPDIETIRDHYRLPSTVQLTQDEDVLDTWFSAALWPLITLGWPNDLKTFDTFFPTNVLVTGFDIIFFWVARMIMFSLKFTKQVPFKQVYITGLIRDPEGQKMSKTKGNILDPIDLIDGIDLDNLIKKRCFGLMQPAMAKRIEQDTRQQFPMGIEAHGTDALRFTFCALANNNRNIRFDLNRLAGYRNFCNKLWNAARFVLMHVNTDNFPSTNEPLEFSVADRFIQSRLQTVINEVHRYFKEYRFDYLSQVLYEFIWHEYCDWYVELSKVYLTEDHASKALKNGTRYTLITILETLLRLANPLIPFITEVVWQELKPILDLTGDTLMLQPYPQANLALIDQSAEKTIQWLQEVVLAIRNIRGEMNVSPAKKLTVLLHKGEATDKIYLNTCHELLLATARLDKIDWLAANGSAPPAATAIVNTLEILIPLAGLIDVTAEKARLEKEFEKLNKEISRLKDKLNNDHFVAKAPVEVITKEKEKLEQLELTHAKLLAQKEKLVKLQ